MLFLGSALESALSTSPKEPTLKHKPKDKRYQDILKGIQREKLHQTIQWLGCLPRVAMVELSPPPRQSVRQKMFRPESVTSCLPLPYKARVEGRKNEPNTFCRFVAGVYATVPYIALRQCFKKRSIGSFLACRKRPSAVSLEEKCSRRGAWPKNKLQWPRLGRKK